MHGNEFLNGYSAKLVEYGLAVAYLILFVGFWRFIHGGKEAAMAVVAKAVELPRAVTAGWFEVPADVALHPGHTWARLEDDGTVAVGLDDLGHRMIGTVDGIALPVPGSQVEQGAAAVTLEAGGKQVGLLSPVDGEVVASNPASVRDGIGAVRGRVALQGAADPVGPERGAAAHGRGGAGVDSRSREGS